MGKGERHSEESKARISASMTEHWNDVHFVAKRKMNTLKAFVKHVNSFAYPTKSQKRREVVENIKWLANNIHLMNARQVTFISVNVQTTFEMSYINKRAQWVGMAEDLREAITTMQRNALLAGI
ncbi:MAG: hypothetical protein PVG39_25005 [Desulfobacteraceae bacterium]|jgi:hypothetical protein